MQNIPKTLAIAALVSALGFGAQTLAAENCATSFYCYGNSSAHVSSTPTRPAPLPPPNPNYIRQRHQAHLALHTNVTHLPTRPPAVIRRVSGQNRTAPVPAARVTVTAIPPAHNSPSYRSAAYFPPHPIPHNRVSRINSSTNTCLVSRQRLLARATELERLAVLDAKRGQRQRSAAQFHDAGKMRNNAQRLGCR